MRHDLSGVKEKAIMSRITWYSLLHHDKKTSVKHKPGAENMKPGKKENVCTKKQTHYLVRGNVKKGIVRASDTKATCYLSRDDGSDEKFKQSELKKPVQHCQFGVNKNKLQDTRGVRVQPWNGKLADEAKHKLGSSIIVERKLAEPMTSGRTLQISIQEVNEDEEEMVIDKLLIKYSRSPHTQPNSKVESESQPSNQISTAPDKTDDRLALVPSTNRSFSLPNEKTGPAEHERALVRVSSCQPNRVAPHVHPKLPDYEDLAAKFSALKQQQQQGAKRATEDK